MTVLPDPVGEDTVHQTLTDALNTIPEGRNNAILIDGRTGQGRRPIASILIASRHQSQSGDWGWDVGVGASYDGKEVAGGVAVKISW